MKGKGKKLEELRTNNANFSSVRPYPEQYREDFEKNEEKHAENPEKMDYRETFHKTPDSEEYQGIKHSLKEMELMKNIKFNPENVEIPDSSSFFFILRTSFLGFS